MKESNNLVWIGLKTKHAALPADQEVKSDQEATPEATPDHTVEAEQLSVLLKADDRGQELFLKISLSSRANNRTIQSFCSVENSKRTKVLILLIPSIRVHRNKQFIEVRLLIQDGENIPKVVLFWLKQKWVTIINLNKTVH
jgi:hypothetical protein